MTTPSSPDPSPEVRELVDAILSAPVEDVVHAAAVGSKFIRARLREGEVRSVMRDLTLNPDLHPAQKVARAFAVGMAEDLGDETMVAIDRLNENEANREICHSHDFCDANEYLRRAMLDETGIDVAAQLPDLPDFTRRMWDMSWRYAKVVGFRRLSAIKGCPDSHFSVPRVNYDADRQIMDVSLPGVGMSEHPLQVAVDYWGRNPHLQLLVYEHDDPNGEPTLMVRFDKQGMVQEVVIAKNRLVLCRGGVTIGGDFTGRETPWETERDSNPTCCAGDRLRMPSGLIATVMRLRDRYEDIEQFRWYDETYGILARLDAYPGSADRHQVYTSVEQAWDVNPLTAGTSEPSDFSFVPDEFPHPETNDRT